MDLHPHAIEVLIGHKQRKSLRDIAAYIGKQLGTVQWHTRTLIAYGLVHNTGKKRALNHVITPKGERLLKDEGLYDVRW